VVEVLDNAKFRALLTERGISHAALARELGISRRAVKSWAQNRTPIPMLFNRLCESLHVRPDDLLRGG
jgi:transcriptional regulator with XRE-family HTH domain